MPEADSNLPQNEVERQEVPADPAPIQDEPADSSEYVSEEVPSTVLLQGF